jgi:hypothetical protein
MIVFTPDGNGNGAKPPTFSAPALLESVSRSALQHAAMVVLVVELVDVVVEGSDVLVDVVLVDVDVVVPGIDVVVVLLEMVVLVDVVLVDDDVDDEVDVVVTAGCVVDVDEVEVVVGNDVVGTLGAPG